MTLPEFIDNSYFPFIYNLGAEMDSARIEIIIIVGSPLYSSLVEQ
jgi:hypothetical protein